MSLGKFGAIFSVVVVLMIVGIMASSKSSNLPPPTGTAESASAGTPSAGPVSGGPPSAVPPAAADPEAAQKIQRMHDLMLYAQNADQQKDYKKALDLYQQACDAGNSLACAIGAWYLVEGKRGVKKDFARAFEMNRKACDGGVELGCNGLGVQYENGRGVRKDAQEAVRLFQRACHDMGGKQSNACDNLKFTHWEVAVDASKLWRQYDSNEVAADNQYRGQMLAVSGLLQSIDKDFTDKVILNLRSPNQFMPTRAYLLESNFGTAAKLRKGLRVLLNCTVQGKTVGSPVLKDCDIEDTKAVHYSDDDDD